MSHRCNRAKRLINLKVNNDDELEFLFELLQELKDFSELESVTIKGDSLRIVDIYDQVDPIVRDQFFASLRVESNEGVGYLKNEVWTPSENENKVCLNYHVYTESELRMLEDNEKI